LVEESPQVYEFDEFRLDVAKRQLLREGEVVPLYSKAFDLLLLLVENCGRDLSKDQILERIWPGQVLEESNLTVNISAVRRALSDKASSPRYLVTIPGRGYRFVANVREIDTAPDQVVIETETISQVTLEEDDDRDAIATREQRQLSPGPPRSFLHRPFVITGLAVAIVVIVGAAIYGAYTMRSARTANHFRQIKLRQLPTDGQTIAAAISPDGRLYAYTNLQKGLMSLRLGSFDGQPSIELRPPGPVSYHHLEFAPDGRSIYYVMSSDEHDALYRMPALGGIPVKLREDVPWFFSIAPDNTRVAFLRFLDGGRSTSVFISNVDGTNERTLLTVPRKRNMTSYCLAWSPDGATIALGASREDDPTVAFLFLLSIDKGELKQLSTLPWKSIGRIAWLRDGSGILTIAAQAGPEEASQIWLVSCPGGEVRRVVNDQNTYDFDLSVAADSNIALTTTHQQMNNVWVAPAKDLLKSRQITFGSLNRADGLLGVDWTPNNRIVYTAENVQGNTIWIMDADGSNPKELTPPGASDIIPSVTADGRFLVFSSNRSGHREIWRANLDGSEAKQLTHCGRNAQPAVSPDGKWIVYRSDCETTGELWRMTIDGGEAQRLTDASVSWPWISPDSKLIACEYATGNNQSQLAVLSIDDGHLTKLFEIPPQANFRYAIRWTANGKSITYRDWSKGLWRQPLDGGPPQQVDGLPDEKIYSNSWSRDGKLFAFTRGVEMRDVVLITNQP